MAEKKYVIDNVELMAEWNWDKNTSLNPSKLTVGTDKKVWWKCSKGHEWQTRINHRNNGSGCPYCAGQRVIKGYNDLQTVNPALAMEWNYEKNNGLLPLDVMANTHKKAWWKCSKGHEWQATIDSRNKGSGCPYCSGKYAVKGENDLRTINPTLASEWCYKKNNGLTPMDVLPSSNKKVWWRCSKGHEWNATINSRNAGCGCPICSSERKTSFPEYAILYYLQNYGLEAMHLYREKGYELDIFIPSKKIAIEYDGNLWHRNKEKSDLEKNLKCKIDGIKLYRIREWLPTLNDSSIDYVVQEGQKDLSKILEIVLSEIIEVTVNVDLARDTVAIENLREHLEKENSLLLSNPEIANNWDYEKNGNLKPEHYAANSNKKVWWKCEKGHTWQAKISHRNNGSGCPYCAGRKVLKGYNDLPTVNPSLANEWNYEKNGDLVPENFTENSHQRVWWKCEKGHEWETTIGHRSNGSGCPYCSGRYAIKGENDLQTINPNLAEEWNYEKNNGLTPMDVLPNSGKKVWWRCSKGHEWQATVDKRHIGRGCPICRKNKKKQ